MPKHFVIREIGSEDSKPYAVVSHGQAYLSSTGPGRKVLIIHDWFEKEHDARAVAHGMEYPDYA